MNNDKLSEEDKAKLLNNINIINEAKLARIKLAEKLKAYDEIKKSHIKK
jgi:hypothetical protein